MFIPKLFVCLRDYSRPTFLADLIAGLTVGVVALPLAMAFAIASGLPPERGIFTAVVAGFLISFLGGSRTQIGGPTGAFVTIVGGIVVTHGYDGLVLCTAMAGVFLMVMGFARFGGMIKFIPFPVITGFTAGIAVIIFSSQIRDLLGLRIDGLPSHFVQQWAAYGRAIGTIQPAATACGFGTVAVILLLRRYLPRIPGMLVAMILAAVLTKLMSLPIETIGSRFGDLPRNLPRPQLPAISLERIQELTSPAITVALLAAIESLLSATVADGMTGTRHKSNMELVAQGAANLGSAMMGGIPATGAIARTATNIKSGAKTPVAGIIHAITLLLILIFLAPLAREIPLACLAGILVVVAWQMSQIEHLRQLFYGPVSDRLVLVVTFLLTIFVDLTVAVQVGVVLAAMLFIRKMSEVTNVAAITRELKDREEQADPQAISRYDVPEGVEVYEITGPFFFGAAEKFNDSLRFLGKVPAALIIRMRDVPAMDSTGLHVMRELLHKCRASGTHLFLAEVHASPLHTLQRSGLWQDLGPDNVYGDLADALDAARQVAPQRQEK